MKGICASSWTVTKNHCMMHGQQNVKFYLFILFVNVNWDPNNVRSVLMTWFNWRPDDDPI